MRYDLGDDGVIEWVSEGVVAWRQAEHTDLDSQIQHSKAAHHHHHRHDHKSHRPHKPKQHEANQAAEEPQPQASDRQAAAHSAKTQKIEATTLVTAEPNSGETSLRHRTKSHGHRSEDLPPSMFEPSVATPKPWMDWICSRMLLFVIFVLFVGFWVSNPFGPTKRDRNVWVGETAAVKEAVQWAWKGYREFAWGHDTLLPLAQNHTDHLGVGLTIVDNLDTLLLLGMRHEFKEASRWVLGTLDFSQVDFDARTSGLVTQVLGGLLSAYELTGNTEFKDKAQELGQRLIPAFSQSSLPMSYVNLHKGNASMLHTKLSPTNEVGLVLELYRLGRLTNDDTLLGIVDRMEQQLYASLMHDVPESAGSLRGLWPTHMDPLQRTDSEEHDAAVDGPHDELFIVNDNTAALYELFLARWILGGRKEVGYFDRYLKSMRVLQHSLVAKSERNFTYIGEIRNGKFRQRMQHAACSLPGTIATAFLYGSQIQDMNASPELLAELRDHLEVAQLLLGFCVELHTVTKTGLLPRAVWFEEGSQRRANTQLREGDTGIRVKREDLFSMLTSHTARSLVLMHRAMKIKDYQVAKQIQEWGWTVFVGMEVCCRAAAGGYHGVSSVFNTKSRLDVMDSTFLSQTLKFLYLLFRPSTQLSAARFYLTTHGHYLGFDA